MSKSFIRFLCGLAFASFVATAFVAWVVAPSYGPPWWSPFAAAAAFPSVVGILIWIMDPDSTR
jgi:uncharacterized membrane protein YbhN (UPF0104 family)